MAVKKLNLVELKSLRESWPNVLEECLNEKDRKVFISRKLAVDMYIDEIPVRDIEKKTGIKSSNILKYVKKCIEVNPDTSNLYGYTALLKYTHIKSYTRNSKKINNSKGLSGSFNKLLEEYPSLVDFIYGNYFGDINYTLEKNMSSTTLHRKFLRECKRLGVLDYEYPFNTNSKGYITLLKYIKSLEGKNIIDTAKREHKNATQKILATGYGKKYSTSPIAPYSQVQLDGHIIDLIYTVESEDKNGNIVRMPATKMWIIIAIDAATRAILGYTLTPSENYSQTDVLEAIRNAIMPRKKIQFTINGFFYPDNGGFPSTAFPELEWALFDTIMLDNAKAHLASNVIYKLTEKLKCAMNFGPVSTPETRPLIERLFLTLENQGYHKLPFTTGSSVSDPKRKNPEKEAVKYSVTYEDIVQITEYFITQYNNSAHTSLENYTPLQVLENKVREARMLPCIANEEQQKTVEGLTNYIIERIIRGGYESGKRPYITFMSVEYRNDIIGVSMNLIGQKILLEINPQDISFIKAYLPNGSELGVLTASGEWGRKSHSIKTRKESLRRQKNNLNINSPFSPIIDGLEQEYRERGIKNRRARTKADIIRKEKGDPLLSEQKKQNKLESNNIKKLESKSDNYTKEELEEISKMSIEEAYRRSLL